MPSQSSSPNPPPNGDSTTTEEERCCNCGGVLFQFEAPADVESALVGPLPTICRGCGQIQLDGQPVRQIAQTKDALPEQAARRGRQVREQLLTDQEARIEKYFTDVYRGAYVQGLMRALAYFTHHSKEGRLRRLRSLWASAELQERGEFVSARMSKRGFGEFQALLAMPPSENRADAQDPTNADAAGPAR